jgi:hypothetical protein
MPLQAQENQYMGVNAHANGWLQMNHKWRIFHNSHITDLTRAIDRALPSGYIAVTEESLQLEIADSPPDEDSPAYRPRPDATIFDQGLRERTHMPTEVSPVGIITPTVETVHLEQTELSAVMIYELTDNRELGRPVTRIELLSPTNKPPYAGAREYEQSRNGALQSGVCLIEIDYLHQQPSMNRILPEYPRQMGSHPFSITVHDPRPSIYEGKTYTIPFDVDQPIPRFDIPLDHGDKVSDFDLGAVYHYTFAQSRVLQQKADYEQAPVDWGTYSKADQERITNRMRMVDGLRRAGKNLDTEGRLPVDRDLTGYLGSNENVAGPEQNEPGSRDHDIDF